MARSFCKTNVKKALGKMFKRCDVHTQASVFLPDIICWESVSDDWEIGVGITDWRGAICSFVRHPECVYIRRICKSDDLHEKIMATIPQAKVNLEWHRWIKDSIEDATDRIMQRFELMQA